MTLTGYCNQNDISYQGIFKVLVHESELYSRNFHPKGEEVSLNVCGHIYRYLNSENKGYLYTMDCDGNKKSLSVFKIIK